MQKNRRLIYLFGFLFSLPVALASYINSSFLSAFIGEKFVSLIYILGSIISIISLLAIAKVWEKFGSRKSLLLITLLDSMAFLTLVCSQNKILTLVAFVCGIALNTLIVFSLDEILKIFTKESATGKIRGAYMAFSNLAWVVAQLSFGLMLGSFSFKFIYFISFLVMFIFLLTSYFSLKYIPDPKYDQKNTLKYLREFFQNDHISKAFAVNLLLQIFFCWMIIYTPLYLSTYMKFSWREIGFIFSIMLMPFFIMPIPVGRYSDKIGERKILIFGFLITSLATLYLFFIQSNSYLVWALALFMTRVGASTIEESADSYFFKHIKPENEEYVGIYRGATPTSYIIGPLFASIIFIFVPSFKYIYLILGILMLSGIYLSSKIKIIDA